MLKVLRVYYRFLWRYPWLMAGFAGAVIVAGAFENVQSYFYKLFVDTLEKGSQTGLVELILVYTIIRISKTIIDNLTYFLGDKVVLPASRDARMAVFKRIQDLDFAYHQSKNTGSLISAIKRGDNAFFDFHHNINIQMTRTGVGFLVMLTLLRLIDARLSLIVLLSLAVNLVAAYMLIKKTYRHESNLTDLKTRFLKLLSIT